MIWKNKWNQNLSFVNTVGINLLSILVIIIMAKEQNAKVVIQISP